MNRVALIAALLLASAGQAGAACWTDAQTGQTLCVPPNAQSTGGAPASNQPSSGSPASSEPAGGQSPGGGGQGSGHSGNGRTGGGANGGSGAVVAGLHLDGLTLASQESVRGPFRRDELSPLVLKSGFPAAEGTRQGVTVSAWTSTSRTEAASLDAYRTCKAQARAEAFGECFTSLYADLNAEQLR